MLSMLENSSGLDRDLMRVSDWIRRSRKTNEALAASAGVDEKTVRLAARHGWNPTADTLRKLLRLVPVDWQTGDPVPAEAASEEAG